MSTREGRVGCAKAAVAAARLEGAEGGGDASSSISAVPTAVAKAEYESESRRWEAVFSLQVSTRPTTCADCRRASLLQQRQSVNKARKLTSLPTRQHDGAPSDFLERHLALDPFARSRGPDLEALDRDELVAEFGRRRDRARDADGGAARRTGRRSMLCRRGGWGTSSGSTAGLEGRGWVGTEGGE